MNIVKPPWKDPTLKACALPGFPGTQRPRGRRLWSTPALLLHRTAPSTLKFALALKKRPSCRGLCQPSWSCPGLCPASRSPSAAPSTPPRPRRAGERLRWHKRSRGIQPSAYSASSWAQRFVELIDSIVCHRLKLTFPYQNGLNTCFLSARIQLPRNATVTQKSQQYRSHRLPCFCYTSHFKIT